MSAHVWHVSLSLSPFPTANLLALFRSVIFCYPSYPPWLQVRAACLSYRWLLASLNPYSLSVSIFGCLHCTDSIPKIHNKYSQKWNCAASVPILTFMFQWAIYIFPRSVCLFCCRKIGGRVVGIHKSSQKHESGNWDWGHAVSFLEVHISDFLCSV